MQLAPTPDDLGPKISGWMAHAGLRKIELARRLDVTPATVTKWVKGLATPTYKNLVRIADAVGAHDSDGNASLSVFFTFTPEAR